MANLNLLTAGLVSSGRCGNTRPGNSSAGFLMHVPAPDPTTAFATLVLRLNPLELVRTVELGAVYRVPSCTPPGDLCIRSSTPWRLAYPAVASRELFLRLV